MTTSLLIADDSPLARSAIRTALSSEPSFEIVGEAENGYEALQMAVALKPQIALLDINMPRCDGLLATRLIRRQASEVIVVILTVSDDPADLFEAIQSGAQGFLSKSLDPVEWLSYLKSLSQGETSVSRGLAGRLLASFRPTRQPDCQESESGLTERELEVIRLVGRAMTNREIAETLFISEQTVKNHLKNILAKLLLKNRVDLAVYARRLSI